MERKGIKGYGWIIYRSPSLNVDYITNVAFIFCIEKTELGYRRRIVMNVVDNA